MLCRIEPYLLSVKLCEQSIILTAFSARIFTRVYVQGYKVHIKSVTDAIVEISKTCQLVGEQRPIYQTEVGYFFPIERLVKGFR